MHFTSIFVSAMAFTSSMASVLPSLAKRLDNPLSKIPGYPIGIPITCLNDAQANFLAEAFRSVLANPNRQQANVTAQLLLAPNYTELSDSIAILDGKPLGVPSFTDRAVFIQGALSSPPLTGFQTLKIVHDCTNIVWHWRLTGLGLNKYPVRGYNSFVVNPTTGVIQSNTLEFNSIAWGIDTGYTVTPPPRA